MSVRLVFQLLSNLNVFLKLTGPHLLEVGAVSFTGLHQAAHYFIWCFNMPFVHKRVQAHWDVSFHIPTCSPLRSIQVRVKGSERSVSRPPGAIGGLRVYTGFRF